jgi:MFS superfamily sulfate permease-like transporter
MRPRLPDGAKSHTDVNKKGRNMVTHREEENIVADRPEKVGVFCHLREDLLASIVVFLVALPLCIGIAVAVGVSPARALITGIVGGLIVGMFSGAPLQVSGPAAGLFVLVADLLNTAKAKYLAGHGNLDELSETARAALEAEAGQYALLALGFAGLIAGAMQLAAGWLRMGQWFRAVSPAVIKGMLAGIGVLILASQMHVMLDHKPFWGSAPAHGGLQYLATIPDAVFKTLSFGGDQLHHWAAALGLATIAVIIFWPKYAPKRARIIPGALVAVVTASLLAWLLEARVEKIVVPANFLSEISLPNWQSFGMLFDSSIVLAGVVIGIVASAETLLCAAAVDQMHTGPRTNYDRELMAQGVGNTICGLLGALPMTGVIVRSSANVQAGAKSRLSSILHGAWLLLFVAIVPSVLSYIPKASLGAMLVYTGWKLIDMKAVRELWRVHRIELGIYAVTMLVIVVEDLLMGVITGVALSAVRLLYIFTYLETNLVVTTDLRQARVRLSGAATFVRLPKLAAQLERVPAGAELHVDMRGLNYIDHACLDLLMSWAKRHEVEGGRLVIDWDSLHARFAADPQTTASTTSQSMSAVEPAGSATSNGRAPHAKHLAIASHPRNGDHTNHREPVHSTSNEAR